MPKPAQDIDLSRLNTLEVLAEVGIQYESRSDSEVVIRCPHPNHEDSHPSCGINLEKKLFKCFACDASGDLVALLAMVFKKPRNAILAFLEERYNVATEKSISPAAIEKWHAALTEENAPHMLRELEKRGVTKEDIRTYRLGFDGERITIPIKNRAGQIVDARRYLPGAQRNKIVSTQGYGAPRIFGVDQLSRFDRTWIQGGEVKALACTKYLHLLGCSSVSSTTGEKSWEAAWTEELRGKIVYICFDIDDTGQVAARKVAQQIFQAAEAVFIIKLPLDPKKYPKGDVNDYIHSQKPDFQGLMDNAERFEGLEKQESTSEIQGVPFSELGKGEYIGLPVEFQAIISSSGQSLHTVPSAIRVSCTQDAQNCHVCGIQNIKQDVDGAVVDLKFGPQALQMVGALRHKWEKWAKELLHIPTCKKYRLATVPGKYWTLTGLVLSEELKATTWSPSRDRNYIGYSRDLELTPNTLHDFKAVPWLSEKDSEHRLVIFDAKEAEDSLDKFQPSETDLKQLEIFRPTESVGEKVGEITRDLESNVTRIYGRTDFHILLDLTYHSPLFFQLDNRRQNGWLSVLAIGDTSQGKSETAQRLLEHYKSGLLVSGKNASAAGLLGGVQQMSSGDWFITWGHLPQQDRKLVVLEETKGLHPKDIGRMTDARSTGIISIAKIRSQSTYARTRLFAISNPRSSRKLENYTCAVSAVPELIGEPEDVRRFDAVIFLDERDGPTAEDLAQYRSQTVEHKYTSELCSKLVLWAWTRKPEEIIFSKEAEDACRAWTKTLCEKYSSTIPLLDKGTTTLKLARLAVSLSLRLFTTTVSPEHVEFVAQLLDRIYSHDSCGYDRFSIDERAKYELRDTGEIQQLISALDQPDVFLDEILSTDEITREDVENWSGREREPAQKLFSALVRCRAIYRSHRHYRKSPAFIKWLREFDISIEKPPEQF